MDVRRLRQIAQDRKDAIDALVQRWETANIEAHTPSRRPSKLGVRVSGNSEADINYSDPTGQTAAILLDTLDRISDEMRNRREDDYALARLLEDFAPAKHWDNGIRRCTEGSCARKHYGLGMCETHYRAYKRAEERRGEREAS